MKRAVIFIVVMIFSVSGTLVHGQKPGDKVVCFTSSMDCKNCETAVYEHLRFERGVKDLQVDHVSNTIRVVFNDKRNSVDALKKSVEKKGYKAEKISEEDYFKILVKTKNNPQKPAAGHHH